MALVGATASGKTELAVAVAQALGDTEILVVDSMAVYRGMDIGTAKPSPAQRAAVAHHLLDLADPAEEWTLTRWMEAAHAAVAEVEARGRRCLLVGGTSLYMQALVDGFDPPGRWPEIRQDLEAEPDTARLYRRLEALDPLAASRMLASNRRRVIRALEVCLGSGRPFSAFGPGVGAYGGRDWDLVGLWLPREVVAQRIATRLEAMVSAGLLDEVRWLRDRPEGLSRTARQALGYKELLEHLDQGVPLGDALEGVRRRSVAFSRRQRRWWRRDPRVRWYGTGEDPLSLAGLLLRDWRVT